MKTELVVKKSRYTLKHEMLEYIINEKDQNQGSAKTTIEDLRSHFSLDINECTSLVMELVALEFIRNHSGTERYFINGDKGRDAFYNKYFIKEGEERFVKYKLPIWAFLLSIVALIVAIISLIVAFQH